MSEHTDHYDWEYLSLSVMDQRAAVAAHLRARGERVDDSTTGTARLNAAMQAIYWVSEREGAHEVPLLGGSAPAQRLVARLRLGGFIGPSSKQRADWDAQDYLDSHSPQDHIPYRAGGWQ